MIAVLDTNIAIALLLPLPYSEAARSAVARAESAIAPDFLIAEATNALWRIIQAGQADLSDCKAALSRLPLLFDELVPCSPLAENALSQAVAMKHPAYDCYFSALASARDATFMTADQRFAAAVRNSLPRLSVVVVS